ncbi:MAG: helix-turn-helix domain-containing protein [Candidatus Cryptobacteroides sp.]
MNRLFEKVKVFMENNNPYLYGSFSIGELSQKIYANRTHVSKAINRLAGMNYSTFVNTYRVKHAADLIAKDPRMKMEEVAKLSGFNTIPTFNSAFKAIMNERPSEYQAKVQKR